MMQPNTLALITGLCLLGLSAWVALLITFGLVAFMRKMIGWIVQWM